MLLEQSCNEEEIFKRQLIGKRAPPSLSLFSSILASVSRQNTAKALTD